MYSKNNWTESWISKVCLGFCHWLCRCASDVCIKAYTQTHRSRQYMVNRYLFWEVGRWCKTLFFLPPAPFVDEMCAVLDLSLYLMEEVDPYLINRLNTDENAVSIFTLSVKICFSFFHIFIFILFKSIPFCWLLNLICLWTEKRLKNYVVVKLLLIGWSCNSSPLVISGVTVIWDINWQYKFLNECGH